MQLMVVGLAGGGQVLLGGVEIGVDEVLVLHVCRFGLELRLAGVSLLCGRGQAILSFTRLLIQLPNRLLRQWRTVKTLMQLDRLWWHRSLELIMVLHRWATLLLLLLGLVQQIISKKELLHLVLDLIVVKCLL